MNFNQAIIIGRIGRDPETRSVGSAEVCSFSVAVDESFKKADGTKIEAVQWFNVELWNSPAAKYLKKGGLIQVVGRMKQESYVKDGITKMSFKIVGTSVQMGPSASGAAQQNQTGTHSTAPNTPQLPNGLPNPAIPDDGDDLPF